MSTSPAPEQPLSNWKAFYRERDSNEWMEVNKGWCKRTKRLLRITRDNKNVKWDRKQKRQEKVIRQNNTPTRCWYLDPFNLVNASIRTTEIKGKWLHRWREIILSTKRYWQSIAAYSIPRGSVYTHIYVFFVYMRIWTYILYIWVYMRICSIQYVYNVYINCVYIVYTLNSMFIFIVLKPMSLHF